MKVKRSMKDKDKGSSALITGFVSYTSICQGKKTTYACKPDWHVKQVRNSNLCLQFHNMSV